MNEEIHFEMTDDIAIFRPAGEVALEKMVKIVTSAITLAREQQIHKLLVNTTALTGFKSPTLAARYYFVQEWASAARGGVYFALVTRPEMIDPRKFGITVAANFGLTAEVFTTEDEALAWFRSAG